VRDYREIEERLRTAFRAVAEAPGPPRTPVEPAPQGRRRFPSSVPRRRLLVVVVAVAALIALVATVVAYGPRNGGKPVSPPPVPATQPPTSSPPTSLPTSTTTPQSTTSTTALPSPATTVPSGAVVTQQITYQPFVGSKVDPSLHVTGQDSGGCSEYGGGADGRIYYRCIGTSDVLQPCFAGPQGTSAQLVCPYGLVTSNDVLLWTATTVTTTGFVPATTKTPWSMQLSNGMICEFVSAAWGGLGPYGCNTPGITTPADCRTPQTSTPSWTADCQDQETDASPFTSLTVERVWF
jgi:hypothetical protein